MSEREEEKEAPAALVAEGEYRGSAGWFYWGLLAGVAVSPLIVLAAVMLLSEESQSLFAIIRHTPGFMLFCVLGGPFMAALYWLKGRSLARRVTWSVQGLEVQWYRGEPKFFAWDEMARLRTVAISEASSGIVVTTTGGQSFVLQEGREMSEELVAAIRAQAQVEDKRKK